jgi:hypothetical protein
MSPDIPISLPDIDIPPRYPIEIKGDKIKARVE